MGRGRGPESTTARAALDLLLLLRFPASPEAAFAARHAVGGLSPYLEAQVLADAQLLVSELVSNAVRHAGLSCRDGIELCLRASPTALMVEVADRGRGFGERRPPHHGPAEPGFEDPSGWGLFLVEQLASSWGITEGTEVRVWFELRPGARLATERDVEAIQV